MVWIDQLAQFMGVKAVEIFFQPLQLHLQLADLLEQLSLLDLALLFDLVLLASRKQLTGTVQQLLLPLAHLNRVDGVIGGDLLDRLAATDRLHGDSGLEFGTVGAALAHEWETPFQGRYPASEVNDGTCPEKPDQLNPIYSNMVLNTLY